MERGRGEDSRYSDTPHARQFGVRTPVYMVSFAKVKRLRGDVDRPLQSSAEVKNG
jgi:hypothetical protein